MHNSSQIKWNPISNSNLDSEHRKLSIWDYSTCVYSALTHYNELILICKLLLELKLKARNSIRNIWQIAPVKLF